MARRKRPNVPPVRVPAEGGPISEPSTHIFHEHTGGTDIFKPVHDLKGRLDGKTVTVNVSVNDCRRRSILDTPPPYRREWLDANGLTVEYRHGRPELKRK